MVQAPARPETEVAGSIGNTRHSETTSSNRAGWRCDPSISAIRIKQNEELCEKWIGKVPLYPKNTGPLNRNTLRPVVQIAWATPLIKVASCQRCENVCFTSDQVRRHRVPTCDVVNRY